MSTVSEISAKKNALKAVRDNLLIAVICLVAVEITLRILCSFGSLERTIPFVAFIHDTFPKGVDVERSSFVQPSNNPILEFELIPNTQRGHLSINSMGFRGKEAAREADPEVFRIAVVGDSETFCEGLSEEQTFTSQLEKYLNENGTKRPVEVLNFGVPGYNTVQECEYLRKSVLPLKPDMVIIRYVFNDPAIGNPHILVDAEFIGWSYSYLLFKFLSRDVTPLMALWQKHQKDMPGFYLELHRSSYFASARKQLVEIEKELQELEIPFFVLIDPEMTGGSIHEDYPYDEIHQALKDMGDGHLKIIDPLEALRQGCKAPEELWLTPHDPHKNAEGNRIMAEHTAKMISGSMKPISD